MGLAAVGGHFALAEGRLRLVEATDSGAISLGEVDADPTLWLSVAADGTVTLYSPKVEFGQGIHTALAQIAAEELGVTVTQVRVEVAHSRHGFIDFVASTIGSISVSSLFRPIRQAAATLRTMLLTEAARQLGVAAAALTVAEGMVRAPDGATLSFGQVVAAKTGEWEAPAEPVTLKPQAEWTTIGQAVPRIDLEAKIRGQAIYGYDVRMDGMLFGAFAQPNRFGARLGRTDAGRAEASPGVVRVVVDGDFAGVAAETRSAAWAGVSALAAEWTGGSRWNQSDLEQAVRVPGWGGTEVKRVGDVDRALAAGTPHTAEYWTPLAAHAFLEPQAALVHVHDGRAEAWVAAQGYGTARDAIARATGLANDTITVHLTYLGGGLGGKFAGEVAFAAAKLSQATGRPVHVGRTRTEEFRNGGYRPPSHHVMRGALGPDGRVTAFEHRMATGPIFNLGPAIALVGFDPGALGGMASAYAFANERNEMHNVDLPMPTTSWRSLGHFPNTFAVESFMDELAEAAGADPLQFRLDHLADTPLGRRLRSATEQVRTLSGWETPPPPGHGRGVAIGFYGQTAVAQVAEVSLAQGALRVDRFWCVVDCGLVVNPDGALAQAQGSIVMGLSATLHEAVTLRDGTAEVANFGTYPLLTLAETPVMDVAFVASDEAPSGMGEPVIVPVAASVANAAYALTGQRLRSLPLRP
jgi:isoquinoline 1-oxidoreductase beta subunit